MAQNPATAIVHLGHSNGQRPPLLTPSPLKFGVRPPPPPKPHRFLSAGTVTLWSPNVKEPLVRMLCHRGAVRAAAVDPTGT